MSIIIYVAIGIGVVLLLRNLFTRLAADKVVSMADRRRATALVVSRGELVDGNRHMNVALALTDRMLIYENPDLEGCLDRSTIHEVEYENELATGQSVGTGKVLRLRCFSTTFEFVVPAADVQQWKVALPPHRLNVGTF